MEQLLRFRLPKNWKNFAEATDVLEMERRFGKLKKGVYDVSCLSIETGTLLVISLDKGEKKAFLLREEDLNEARQALIKVSPTPLPTISN